MIKIKKILSLAIIGSMMLSTILTGCTSKQTSPTPTKETLKPYNVSWYFVGPGTLKDTPLVQDAINKYLKDKINATVELDCLDWGTYEQKMKAMIASGEQFDICFTANWFNNYVVNSQNGAFVELNSLMDQYAPKTKALLGTDFLKASQINGKNYGVPTNKEKARDNGIEYNKTIADKYNFDMTKVKSYQDLEPMLQIIKDKEPGTVPLLRGRPDQLIEWNVEPITDVGIIDGSGKFVNQYETPEFKAAYAEARNLYVKGYFRKDVATAKDLDAIGNAGKYFVQGMNFKPGFADEANTKNKALGFQVGQIDITKTIMTNSDSMGSLNAISKTSKDPARAMMFLELVNTDKYLNNLINFGIETTDYTKVSDNVVQPIANSGYSMNMQWLFGNQFLNYLQPSENPTKWDAFNAYNKSAVKAADLGFVFNSDSVSSEIAACNNAIAQYQKVLSVGSVDPEVYLPQLTNKLKASGSEKIVAEKQKQFDTWKASSNK